jgi:rhodanese-related sulfurtransferase
MNAARFFSRKRMERSMFGWFGGSDKVKTLSPGELRDLLREKDSPYILVDVREDNEWANGRIPGAIHVPLSRFAKDVGKIPTSKQIIFYCQSGMRSRSALKLAKAQGLDADTHLGGGISEWRRHDMPIMR